MSETVTAKIVSATVAEEKTFEDSGDTMIRYEVDLDINGTRRNDLNMWFPKGKGTPPTEGEEGEFIIEKQGGRGDNYKVRRKPKPRSGGGGYGGGRSAPTNPDDAGYGYRTHPDDALRMSRSTALQAAVAHPKLAEADSETLLKAAKAFANFIYNGPEAEAS